MKLCDLSTDILVRIVLLLPIESAIIVTQVCTQLRLIQKYNQLWKDLYCARWSVYNFMYMYSLPRKDFYKKCVEMVKKERRVRDAVKAEIMERERETLEFNENQHITNVKTYSIDDESIPNRNNTISGNQQTNDHQQINRLNGHQQINEHQQTNGHQITNGNTDENNTPNSLSNTYHSSHCSTDKPYDTRTVPYFLEKSPDYLIVVAEMVSRYSPMIKHLLNPTPQLNHYLVGMNFELAIRRLLSPGTDYIWANIAALCDRLYHYLLPVLYKLLLKLNSLLAENVRKRIVGNVIEFSSLTSYTTTIVSCINLILKNLACKLQALEYFIEDFSIVRVHAGLTRGHPLVVMCIINEVLRLFWNSYTIKIKGVTHTNDFAVCKNFFRVDKAHYALLSYNNSKRRYTVQAFSTREVFRSLRGRNFSEHLIRQLLDPVSRQHIFQVLSADPNIKSVSLVLPSVTSHIHCMALADFAFMKLIVGEMITGQKAELPHETVFDLANSMHFGKEGIRPLDTEKHLDIGKFIFHIRSKSCGIVIDVQEGPGGRLYYTTLTDKKAINVYDSANVKFVRYDVDSVDQFDPAILEMLTLAPFKGGHENYPLLRSFKEEA